MANYYFSNTGSDSNNGTSELTPFQTIAKCNSLTLAAGDNLLFKKGDIFYGQILPQRSTINYGQYGTGNRSILSAFQVLTGWTDQGSGIYRAATTTTNASMLVVDNVVTPKGRYPKNDWLRFDSHSGLTSITDADLPDSPNYVGSEVVIKTSRYSIETRTILTHASGALTFAAVEHELQDNYGYFIQNHSSCLTAFGDWYISGGYIYMYFGAVDPATKTIKVSFYDNTIKAQNKTDITLSGICLEGGYDICLYANVNCTGFIADDVEIKFSGRYGANSVASGFTVTNSYIHDCADFGVYSYAPSAVVTGNTVDRIGLWEGMGKFTGYMGLSVNGNDSLCRYNRVTNTGYNGIIFRGNNTEVSYNFVDTYCKIIDDGGGIYTSNNTYTGRIIDHNICINGIGNYSGSTNYGNTTPSTTLYAHGIYNDEMAKNVTITNNSCINNSYSGLFLHSATSITLTGNTAYNNAFTQLLFAHDTTADNMASILVNNNILVAKGSTQYCFYFRSNYNDLNFGSASGNVYARPVDDDNVFGVDPYNGGLTTYDLAGWKTLSGYDVNSTKSPKSITDVNDLSIVYNDTSVAKIIPLAASAMDTSGKIYVSEITLQPFTSAVLIKHAMKIGQIAGKFIKYDGKFVVN